ncbi:MAG TPA: signal peptidase I, partial [Bacillota bacterium]|nr:signal peptidase I [Bacillota bacterium]
DGHSMDATLQNGERLIINKMVYDFHSPQKGDIIVFHANPTQDYVKRVIAVGGDLVQEKEDILYINGQAVQEPYLDKEKKLYPLKDKSYTSDFGPITIPNGKIFVLGDNRPVSNDSRYIGPVDVKQVVGRADFSLWPINTFHKLN